MSRSLGGDSRSESPFHGNLLVGNRFSGSWFAEMPVPVPANYVDGVDLRLRSAEATESSRSSTEKPTRDGIESSESAGFATKIPLGLLIMILWSAVLAVFRRPELYSRTDELFWVLPLLAFGSLAATQVGSRLLIEPSLLLVPFGIIAASKLAVYLAGASEVRRAPHRLSCVDHFEWSVCVPAYGDLSERARRSTQPSRRATGTRSRQRRRTRAAPTQRLAVPTSRGRSCAGCGPSPHRSAGLRIPILSTADRRTIAPPRP